MKTGLFPKLYIPCRWRRGTALCTGTTHPSTFFPPRLQNHHPWEAACAGAWGQELIFAAVVLMQGCARCSRARRQVDLPRVPVSSPRSCAAAFDLPVFGLAGWYAVSFHSPWGCVQGVEWAGQASQAKYSRRRPTRTSQAQHPWSGMDAGGHPWPCVQPGALLWDTGREKRL